MRVLRRKRPSAQKNQYILVCVSFYRSSFLWSSYCQEYDFSEPFCLPTDSYSLPPPISLSRKLGLGRGVIVKKVLLFFSCCCRYLECCKESLDLCPSLPFSRVTFILLSLRFCFYFLFSLQTHNSLFFFFESNLRDIEYLAEYMHNQNTRKCKFFNVWLTILVHLLWN